MELAPCPSSIQIFGSLARAGHPMAKFMWGSTASLTADGKMPNREAHRRLVEFKARHYTAPSMTLAVQSQEELDTLQQWVRESFAAVPDNGQPREGRRKLQFNFNVLQDVQGSFAISLYIFLAYGPMLFPAIAQASERNSENYTRYDI